MSNKQKEMAYEQIIKLHEGETPISVSVDENTGIVAEIYEVKDETLQPFAAGWQEIATDWFTMYNDSQFRTSANKVIAYSGGGDFGLRVYPYGAPLSIKGDYALINYQLFEYDPQNSDDYVGSGSFIGNAFSKYDIVWRGIGDYVDGTNGKAEFYVKHGENFLTKDMVKVIYID